MIRKNSAQKRKLLAERYEKLSTKYLPNSKVLVLKPV